MDPNPGRKIIHVDMDAFYSSVEQRDRPELKGKPVVVGGSPKSRSVVCAASYEARRFGIRSAMSCAKAARLCPEAIFIPPDFSRYVAVSRQIHEIFDSVTELVEPLSLDEAYLDVTRNKLGEPLARQIAIHVKDRIRNETGLTASAGVGPSKFIAKIASDLRKPDGLVVIPPEKVAQFVEKLDIEKLWGVGPATAKRLHELGIWNTADVRRAGLQEMERILGGFGTFLHGLALGHDPREVHAERESKSSGSETTFEKDILDRDVLIATISELSDEIAEDLRKMKRPGRTVTLKVKYADFTTITRSRTLKRFVDSADVIAEVASRLLIESTDAGSRPARLVGVTVSNLWSENEPEQLWLEFPPPHSIF